MQLSSSKLMQMSFNLIPFSHELNQAGNYRGELLWNVLQCVQGTRGNICIHLFYICWHVTYTQKKERKNRKRGELRLGGGRKFIFLREAFMTSRCQLNSRHLKQKLRSSIFTAWRSFNFYSETSLFLNLRQAFREKCFSVFASFVIIVLFLFGGQPLWLIAVLRVVLAEASCWGSWPVGANPAERSLLYRAGYLIW